MEPKYYESHVTIEPVFGERLHLFEQTCSQFGYKVAKLLMQKDRESVPERSNKDSFCTGHSNDFDDLMKRMDNLHYFLRVRGFEVYRCKIEAILVDERYGSNGKKSTQLDVSSG
jgi:hypothetical protein